MESGWLRRTLDSQVCPPRVRCDQLAGVRRTWKGAKLVHDCRFHLINDAISGNGAGIEWCSWIRYPASGARQFLSAAGFCVEDRPFAIREGRPGTVQFMRWCRFNRGYGIACLKFADSGLTCGRWLPGRLFRFYLKRGFFFEKPPVDRLPLKFSRNSERQLTTCRWSIDAGTIRNFVIWNLHFRKWFRGAFPEAADQVTPDFRGGLLHFNRGKPKGTRNPPGPFSSPRSKTWKIYGGLKSLEIKFTCP